MAEPKSIARYGDQLTILMDDGRRILAYPTVGETWIVTGNGSVDPPPRDGNFSWPFDPNTTVSSEYGPREGGTGSFHEGIDFGLGGVSTGDSIYAAGPGVMEQTYYHANFGNLAIIFHGTIDGYDWRTLYAHMLQPSLVSEGTDVVRGHHIGDVDTTGNAFGAHLHFETHRCAKGGGIIWNIINNSNPRTAINPRSFMTKYGDGNVLNPNP